MNLFLTPVIVTDAVLNVLNESSAFTWDDDRGAFVANLGDRTVEEVQDTMTAYFESKKVLFDFSTSD